MQKIITMKRKIIVIATLAFSITGIKAVPATMILAQAANADKPAVATFDAEKQFAQVCGLCHQDGGRASGYGPKLMGSDKSDDEIFDRIKKGKPGRMAAFGGRFNDDEIRELTKYIRNLAPKS